MKKLALIITFFSFQVTMAQQEDSIVADATGLLHGLIHGKFNALVRYNFIATDNANSNPDPYANAAGIAIKYKTKSYKNLSFTIGGAAVANIKSSLTSDNVHPTRYEIGLFDLEHPGEKFMGRIEDLHVSYQKDGFHATAGRQVFQTPFLNPQDGRMRPTMAEGMLMAWKKEKTKISAGLVSRISPRSIYSWKTIESSFGLLPQGVTVAGLPARYAGNMNSKAIVFGSVQLPLFQNLTFQAWDQWVDNVFNTVLIQLDYENKKTTNWYASVQAIRQDAINFGGNPDPAKTYFEKDGSSFSFGMRSGWKTEHIDVSLNYNRITSLGRYLMPREWGKEPFFTFMPRERNEGLGGLHAFTASVTGRLNKTSSSLVFGYFDLPGVKNSRLNKYGMPSYFQLNADIRYAFHDKVEGSFLYVYKGLTDGDHYEEKYVYNKVNMSLFHLALNYHF